jgi:hypothetical protein
MENNKMQQTQLSLPGVEEVVQFDKIAFIVKCGSISSAIRRLHESGKSRSEIATMLDKRYQHVRNVLITPIKRESRK